MKNRNPLELTVYFVVSFALLVSIVPGVRQWIAVVLAERHSCCSVTQILDDRANDEARRQLELSLYGQVKLIHKDADGYSLWDSPVGAVWMPVDEPSIVVQLVAEEKRAIYPACGRGETVLDCGAHVGLFTRRALKDGAASVVAIEPSPRNLECLRRNLAAEIKSGKVIVYPKGVWDSEVTLIMKLSGDTISDRINEADGAVGESIKVTTIDKIKTELALRKIDYIKMDIEGAERRALDGARVTIIADRPRLVIATYHMPDDPDEVNRIVLDACPSYKRNCHYCAKWFGRPRIVPEIMTFE